MLTVQSLNKPNPRIQMFDQRSPFAVRSVSIEESLRCSGRLSAMSRKSHSEIPEENVIPPNNNSQVRAYKPKILKQTIESAVLTDSQFKPKTGNLAQREISLVAALSEVRKKTQMPEQPSLSSTKQLIAHHNKTSSIQSANDLSHLKEIFSTEKTLKRPIADWPQHTDSSRVDRGAVALTSSQSARQLIDQKADYLTLGTQMSTENHNYQTNYPSSRTIHP